jgi:hypothetical protein
MSIPCVCGCPDALHLNYSDCCINWHSDGCMCFHADDGSDQGTLTVPPFSNHYPPNSRYSTPKGGFDVS